ADIAPTYLFYVFLVGNVKRTFAKTAFDAPSERRRGDGRGVDVVIGNDIRLDGAAASVAQSSGRSGFLKKTVAFTRLFSGRRIEDSDHISRPDDDIATQVQVHPLAPSFCLTLQRVSPFPPRSCITRLLSRSPRENSSRWSW